MDSNWTQIIVQMGAVGIIAVAVYYAFTRTFPSIALAFTAELKEQRNVFIEELRAQRTLHIDAESRMRTQFTTSLSEQRMDFMKTLDNHRSDLGLCTSALVKAACRDMKLPPPTENLKPVDGK